MTSITTGRTPAAFSTASLYVGDLHSDVCEQHLFEKFSTAGPVLSIRVCRDAITRRSLGYAYVNFQQTADAERALETLNFELLYGRPMRIMWCQRDPALRRSGSSNIFIKNLDKSIDNKSIYDTFSLFGNILSCKVATDSEGNSKGYAFVHFETEESAIQAIEKVNGMLLEKKKVYVGKFVPRATRALQLGEGGRKFTNVFVKNFADELDKTKLEELFCNFGEITSAVVMADDDGKSKGFGFVAFKKPDDALKAVKEMQDFELPSGRKLNVCRALKKEERSAELKRKFEVLKAERQQQYHGVNLYVKNLDDSFNDEKLREEFEKFGKITSVKVMLDDSGRSKGFGFVCFENAESASKAVEVLNGRIIGSKPLYVGRAQRKEERKAQLASMFMQNIASARFRNAGVIPNPICAPGSTPLYVAPHVSSQRTPSALVASVPAQLRPPAPRWSALSTPSSNVGIPPQYFVHGFGQVGRTVDVAHTAIPEESLIPGQTYSADFRSRFPSTSTSVFMQQQPRSNYQQYGYKYPAANVKEVNRQITSMRLEANQASQRENHLESLNAYNLAQATPEQQKQILGERLYPLVGRYQPGPDQGKITGMMLDMEPSELLMLLENEEELRTKVTEAVRVLHQAKAEATHQ